MKDPEQDVKNWHMLLVVIVECVACHRSRDVDRQ